MISDWLSRLLCWMGFHAWVTDKVEAQNYEIWYYQRCMDCKEGRIVAERVWPDRWKRTLK